MKQLELIFKNGADKNRTLRIKQPKENLSPDIVQQAMERIVEADAFYLEGEKLYAELSSARYVERIVTDIFKN